MNFIKSRRFYVSLVISVIISLFLVLPMILGLMGYDIFNRRPAVIPEIKVWSAVVAILRQWVCYFLMIFILLFINAASPKVLSGKSKIISSIAIGIIFFFLFSFLPPAPFSLEPHGREPGMEESGPPPQGGIMPQAQAGAHDRPPGPRKVPDIRMMSELFFIFITSVLIGHVVELAEQKQLMQLENEQLRGENLQNRYDVLKNQIDPHFFFNSLNSLSALVREGRNDNAIKYIGELSNTYRYVMQSPGKDLVTVAEELESISAYCYLLQVRYENKLFVDIKVEEETKKLMMPVLSLQPLIENVVKHNVISSAEPLTITITSNGKSIKVTNPIKPKQDDSEKSGIGLKNLATRYKLQTGKEIEIYQEADSFIVSLPLIKPVEA
jgi:hypothetical protein